MGRLHNFLEKRPPYRRPVQIEFGVGVGVTGCLMPLAVLAAMAAWALRR